MKKEMNENQEIQEGDSLTTVDLKPFISEQDAYEIITNYYLKERNLSEVPFGLNGMKKRLKKLGVEAIDSYYEESEIRYWISVQEQKRTEKKLQRAKRQQRKSQEIESSEFKAEVERFDRELAEAKERGLNK